MSSPSLNRRDLLKRIGLVGVGVAGSGWLAGVPRLTGSTAVTMPVDPRTANCVLMPSMTAGPYYFDANQLRSDITEGRPGAPLTLSIRLVDVDDCLPIGDAIVDLWHCDALGLYSGYNLPDGNTIGEDFLRGIQITDANGVATFQTIFPGWYLGRANHMHLKVRFSQTTYITSQLFFPQELGDTIQATYEPYRSRGVNQVKNDEDGFFTSVEEESSVMVSIAQSGDHFVGSVTIGIQGLSSAIGSAPPPPRCTLTRPFPNPTPSVSTLWLTLPRGESSVRVALFGMGGEEVTVLHHGPLLGGRHAVEVDGTELAPGIYTVRADVGTEVLIETVAIVR